MKIPISWLKDFVDIDIPIDEAARLLTMSGMEVDEIHYVGWELPQENKYGFKITGISWDRGKIVVAELREVMPHPNADRLVLCDLYDGQQQHTVLTGAPNLFEYKGKGPLPKPIKVAYAREGATLYDGHAEGLQLTTLKRAKIRGVESYSMVCSEKELGVSEEHEGVIILDDDAPAGTALADYMGDAVFEISILPNMARNASMLGVARELAALTRQTLRKPKSKLQESGDPLEAQVKVEITDPGLNPRFTLGLIRGVEIKPSPYWVQRRLRLAGMRPINNIVDATNYTMLEIGQPLHAFDYDALKSRAGRKAVTLITRVAKAGEKLTTLDGVDRTLQPPQVLVCDEKGPLSIAGVMGGAESEVYDGSKEVLDVKGIELQDGAASRGKIAMRPHSTTNILLEAAAWNFINIRRTANAHNLNSEASYRFSRGVHPALAEAGLQRCLYWMAAWGGGSVAPGIVDDYPLPAQDPTVTLTHADVKRLLGIDLPSEDIVALLERLEFKCKVKGEKIVVQTPPIRMDIGEGVVGVADVIEEIARLYGYDNLPETRMADALPPQRGNPSLEREERVRDILVSLGLQEIYTYRMTSPESERRLLPRASTAPAVEYVRVANPITPDKRVLRSSVLAGVLEVVERNIRLSKSLAFFEIGPVFEPSGNELPREPRRLAIALTGLRDDAGWDTGTGQKMDFFDLKGLVEGLMQALHLSVTYAPLDHPSFHPGKCAAVMMGEKSLGVFGELHPLVQENYDFTSPVLAADLDLEAILEILPFGYETRPVSEFPPVLEDIAVIVDEAVPAERVEALIRQNGGATLAAVRLFDVFRGEQIGAGRKSLAYSLTYQSFDKTLTDDDAAQIRSRIVKRLEQELGARLRS